MSGSSMPTPHSHDGYCPICEGPATFVIHDAWLRDHYRCAACESIPRNRALANALGIFCPDWRESELHESSPGGPLSDFLRRSCPRYTSSYCYDDVPRGAHVGPHRSEDLAALTFADASLDMLVTSDVFEHVLEPERAFREIARVLRPAGAHVFTMPWYPALEHTRVRAARRDDGTVVQLCEPVYHGNPLTSEGALVTRDWGRDFVDVVLAHGGLATTIYVERDRAKGLDGEFLEVFVSRKR